MVFDEDDEFFSDKAKKKEDCDAYAFEHLGGPVGAVSPQGKLATATLWRLLEAGRLSSSEITPPNCPTWHSQS